MILFKIFQEFLLPSIFVWILILIGLIFLFKRRKQKTGKILIIFGILFYYFFSINPFVDLILKPLENKYLPVQRKDLDRAERIVLLLGGIETNPLRADEVLRLQFLKEEPFEIIISGRDPINLKSREGEEVKEFLIERGISPENIILEEKSKTTKESAENLKEILAKEPFFLVTSAYHLPRAMMIFQKFGSNPIPTPADFKIKRNYDILDFFPDAENLRNSDLVFHEYFGILFYKFLTL